MALFLLLSILKIVQGGELKDGVNSIGVARDSYLDAYKETHDENVNSEIKRKSNHQTGVEDYPNSDHPYPSSHKYYGMPQSSYGPPAPQSSYPNYGPPSHHHHHPLHHYGSPVDSSYGIPYSLLGIFDKFKLKLNLITIFKILLKIVLFKKFVSFVAIICFLLFIPWLKAKKAIHHHNGGGGNYDDDDEEDEDGDLMRKMPNRMHLDNNRINNATVKLFRSIEKFTEENSEKAEMSSTN